MENFAKEKYSFAETEWSITIKWDKDRYLGKNSESAKHLNFLNTELTGNLGKVQKKLTQIKVHEAYFVFLFVCFASNAFCKCMS